MQVQTCCPQCQTPVTVNVPGTAGLPAYTNTTANFIVPAIGANVNVMVVDTSWMVTGEQVVLPGPANFIVVAPFQSTQVTLKFLGQLGDLAAGTTISSGALISPTGIGGVAGNNGYATSPTNFQIPGIGTTNTLTVDSTNMFGVGSYVSVMPFNNASPPTRIPGIASYIVTAINSLTSLTVKFLGNPGDLTVGTFCYGALIGPSGAYGQNAFTNVAVQFTIPAVGSTVTVTVGSTTWMVVGENVVATGPATFQVTAINSPTSVTLTFLGFALDLAPGNIITNTASISPAGSQPFVGAPNFTNSLTPYVLTTSLATVGVSLTITQIGSYRITARLNLQYSSAYEGFNGANAVTISINRTNNTPATLNFTTVYPDAIQVAHVATETFGVFIVEAPIYTTTNTNDTLVIEAGMAHALGAGTISAVEILLIALPVG